jgi:resuscitation-promoting factor RpfB
LPLHRYKKWSFDTITGGKQSGPLERVCFIKNVMKSNSRIFSSYRHAHQRGRHHVHKRPYLVPIFGLVLGGIIVGGVLLASGGKPNRPSNSHVVYLFDSGKHETLGTKAATVGELVKKLPLKLIPEDVVEPALDTPIVEDNFRVNIYRARPVTIVDVSSKQVTLTAQKSPRMVAEQAGIKVYPEDNIVFAPGSVAENIIGEKVVIDRATPVALNLYGTPLIIRTHAKTVEQMLHEKGVKTNTDDTFQPATSTPITPGLQVAVIKNGIQVATITEPIPAPQQIVQDDSLSFGTQVVRQAGSAGSKVVTYQILVQNGVEVSRTALQSLTVQEPVPQIIARGKAIDINADKTSLMAAAGISSGDYAYANYIISHESGWCWLKWQGQVGYCPGYFVALHDPSSGYGYGLCQATPGSKMASAGGDWQTNPITQLRWCSGYASRYGGWAGSYNHWLNYHSW